MARVPGNLVPDYLTPDERIVFAIIRRAVLDLILYQGYWQRDAARYFISSRFRADCYMLGVDPVDFLRHAGLLNRLRRVLDC